MNLNNLWAEYKRKAHEIRPFLRTKTGSRLALFAILDFVVLFFAPLLHGFVGTAIFGCVATVYLVLIWRKYDSEHVIVPTLILIIPMLLDMIIYHDISVVVGFLVAIAAMLIAAKSSIIRFFCQISDLLTLLLTAGALCVGVVVVACLVLLLVQVAWWILCIIAFFIVVAVFLGVVFSTAAYTASDGRRQARRRHTENDDVDAEDVREENRRDRSESARERRYREYQPRSKNTKIYNLDEDDFRDID